MAEKELYWYEEDDILTLEFDDGTEEECGILGVFDALDKEYDEDYDLIDITDEEEFKKVVAAFEALAVEEA